jgi:signal transduction histidine kinase
MVHQLRTPLSQVKWSLKILMDGDAGKITTAEKELLVKSFASNDRTITLVNDILAVARLESGKLEYRFAPVDMSALLNEVRTNALAVATTKDIRVELLLPSSPIPLWVVDVDKMRNVLQNLLDNAIKYTPKGGAVSIIIELVSNELHIAFRDNGIGIPDAAKEKIFTRFFRAQNAMATESGGSGLGLFIAATIIRHHKGKIWFESRSGEGTTFYVSLPSLR